MKFVMITALAFITLGVWAILAVGSKGIEEGDRLFEKWFEEHKREERSDIKPEVNGESERKKTYHDHS